MAVFTEHGIEVEKDEKQAARFVLGFFAGLILFAKSLFFAKSSQPTGN